ncbi:helix-turn-helix domain-containing protein [Dyella agri]|uniref:Helix-turn-helix domain-containing protein n=1 Tax=Dyella agri TaxID=1926869 RepID=A0ABW8KGW2_9GAMM
MSIAPPHLDAHPAQAAIRSDFHADDLAGGDDGMPVLERPSETISPAMPPTAPARMSSPPIVPAGLDSLSARMQLLIRIEGSASAIARRCGFSEDTVRDWCHGRSDISREHCVIVARALGISLRWLVAGEDSMRDAGDPATWPPKPQAAPVPPDDEGSSADAEAHITVDPNLLASAFRVLQSYIGLVGGSLNPAQRADALAQIYHLLGHAGSPGHANRVIALHALLGGYFCSRKALIG